MIINRGAVEVDNHISRDDIFNYHPLRECDIYFIILNKTSNPLFSAVFSIMPYMYHGEGPKFEYKGINSIWITDYTQINNVSTLKVV